MVITRTSEEIAEVLRDEGFSVRVVNAREERVGAVSEYELINVGSGLMFDGWVKEPLQFLNTFKRELSKKRLAIFVPSVIQALYECQGEYRGNGESVEQFS